MDDLVTWADIKAGTLFVGGVILYSSLKILAFVFPKLVKRIEKGQKLIRETETKKIVEEVLKEELRPIRHDVRDMKQKGDSVMLLILERLEKIGTDNEKK